MSNLIIYTAVYRENEDGKCLRAAASFRVLNGPDSIDKSFESTTATYGDLWLRKLAQMLSIAITNLAKHRTTVKLITGQDVTRKMADKLQRALLDCVGRGELPSRERAELAVLKQGRYTARPNDSLYADVVMLLWEAYARDRIGFAHVYLDGSKDTYDLVKQLHSGSKLGRQLTTGANKRRRAQEAKQVNAPL